MSTEKPDLSYASSFEHPLKRRVVRAIERLSGQPKIRKLYNRYLEEMKGDEPFFAAAVKLLELNVHFNMARLASIPRTGPLVVVANHPFGVLDGVVICWLVSLAREEEDFKILTNAALDGIPELSPYLLKVDFSETREALEANLQMRKEAMELVSNGGCVIVFPSGGVATAPTPFHKTAVDDEWKPFTSKLITRAGASVTPIFFSGQNSRMFQIVSHLSLELRLALVFREVKRRMGKDMYVEIGETLTPEDLKDAGKRAELMNFLREKTYGLAGEEMAERFRAAGKKFQAKKPKVFQ